MHLMMKQYLETETSKKASNIYHTASTSIMRNISEGETSRGTNEEEQIMQAMMN